MELFYTLTDKQATLFVKYFYTIKQQTNIYISDAGKYENG